MSGTLDIYGLVDDGTLLQASFGGVEFFMLDARDPPGRRVQMLLFPGQDKVEFQDLGLANNEINISGLLIGDDYIQQAQTLRAAFNKAGPQTLDHPWLGNFLAVAMKPEISFTQDELGVARFTATFYRAAKATLPQADTQAALLAQTSNLQQAAANLQAQVFNAAAKPFSVLAYARNFVGQVQAAFNTALAAVTGVTSELIGPLVSIETAAMDAVASLELGASFAGDLVALLSAPSAAAVTASQPPIPAAVAPGGSTVTPEAADARITTAMLLAVVAALAPRLTDAAPGPVLALTTQAIILGDAVTAASDIVFSSQQDAQAWLTTLSVALQTLANAALLQCGASPTLAGTVWRAAIATAGALAVDMNARIGRLPAVITLKVPVGVPVWLVAQYLSGDTPANVFATYVDLVQRNSVINPAVTPPGPLEALQQ